MNQTWFRDPVVLGSAGLAVALLGCGVAFFSLRKKPTEQELEQERREFLLEAGRIIDGTYLETTFVDGPPPRGTGDPRRHIFYKYQVSGVSYECSQDVTVLEKELVGTASTPGMPISVRYNPHNPSNSMVIAESWTGLRHVTPPLRHLHPASS